MTNSIVHFEQVSKRYYLGRRKAFVRELLPDFVGKHIHAVRSNELWALKDISFELFRGEALGIIGANGSGKTTLLSILSGITSETSGKVSVSGMVGALIQLGAGFHPELTGKENVYLNASILGLKKDHVNRIYDQIVEFAELGAFMDMPVKLYSSGMYARLGFSVAAHIHPDILLVDEVLAVGDISFQAKCIQRMRDFISQGNSVIFVSHNMIMVQSLCDRVLWLNQGQIVRTGNSAEVIAEYMEETDRRMAAKSTEEFRKEGLGTGDILIEQVILRDLDENENVEFRAGEPLTVEIIYFVPQRIVRPNFVLVISGKHGFLFGASTLFDGYQPDYVEGRGKIACKFKSLPLMPQFYTVSLGIRREDGITMLIRSRQVATFRVLGHAQDVCGYGAIAESLVRDAASVLVSYEWHLPDGQIHSIDFPI